MGDYVALLYEGSPLHNHQWDESINEVLDPYGSRWLLRIDSQALSKLLLGCSEKSLLIHAFSVIKHCHLVRANRENTPDPNLLRTLRRKAIEVTRKQIEYHRRNYIFAPSRYKEVNLLSIVNL